MCELLLGRFNKQHLRFPGFLTNLALLLIDNMSLAISLNKLSIYNTRSLWGCQDFMLDLRTLQSCLISSDAYMIISWQPGIVPSGNANTTVCWSFCISLCMPISKSNELLDYMVPITLHKASLDLYFKWLLYLTYVLQMLPSSYMHMLLSSKFSFGNSVWQERQKVIYEEQKKLAQQQAQIKSQMARYEDELARKRMQVCIRQLDLVYDRVRPNEE